MQTYEFLNKALHMLKDKISREAIVEVLDELEYLYEAVNAEFQELASQLIE